MWVKNKTIKKNAKIVQEVEEKIIFSLHCNPPSQKFVIILNTSFQIKKEHACMLILKIISKI